MIISVASGKGGTGKTTVAVNLALSIEGARLADCDVEEPNVHLFLRPEIEKTERICVPVPEIDRAKCDFCGACAQACAFGALSVFRRGDGGDILLLPALCHNCGACALLCPRKAISETRRSLGVLETGRGAGVCFVSGRLDIGEPKAPPLIREVRKRAGTDGTVIVDCPPGTSCPMMNAVRNTDFCLLVTEPTPFGLHDLGLAVRTVRKLGVPCGVFVNRDDGSGRAQAYCAREGVECLGALPYDEEAARLYARGRTLCDAAPRFAQAFAGLAKEIFSRAGRRA